MKTMSEKNELMVINEFQAPALNPELMEVYREEMDGLNFQFQRVKIPSGGGLAFEVPGDDPENPDLVKELVGIIVDKHPVNAYWADDYTGGNNPPNCSSLDGKHGTGEPGGICATCPFNQFGSDETSGGKACKNMHRVYLLQEGTIMPLLLTLPPTSIKNLSEYVVRLMNKGLNTKSVLTKVTLKKAVNKNGITYSQAVFSLAGKLSTEMAAQVAEYAESLRVHTRRLAVADDEYMQGNGNGKNLDEMDFDSPAESVM